MKTVFTILGLLVATVSFGQDLKANMITDNANIKNLSVSVTVDSAEDVESTFKMKDIKKILDVVEGDEDILFKITCNGGANSKDVSSKVSYSVTGNTNDKNAFLKHVKRVRKAAIKYYENQ